MAVSKDDGRLPVGSLDDALPHLRRPFTPEALKFKVQTVFKDASGCLIVSYIDARLVIERLNLVVGGAWSADYAPVDGAGNAEECFLTVCGVTRRDIGEGTGPQALKAKRSDALKRAAVHFGVGVSVYALPQVTMFANKAGSRLERRGGNKPTLVLTPEGLTWLREGYAGWLGKQQNFGEPLDHGDVADAGGMEDEQEPAQDFVPGLPEPLQDERAVELRCTARETHEAIVALSGPRAYPVGQFRAQLDGAAHSHEELERFVGHLRERLENINSEGSK